MSEIAIFLYGLAVFAIVAAACALIVGGIFEERRDRLELEASQAEDAGPTPSATLPDGGTQPVGERRPATQIRGGTL